MNSNEAGKPGSAFTALLSDDFTPLTMDRLSEIYERTTHHRNGIALADVFHPERDQGCNVQAAHQVLQLMSWEGWDELSLRYLSHDGLTHFTAFYFYRELDVMLHEFKWDSMPFDSPHGLVDWFNATIVDIRNRIAETDSEVR